MKFKKPSIQTIILLILLAYFANKVYIATSKVISKDQNSKTETVLREKDSSQGEVTATIPNAIVTIDTATLNNGEIHLLEEAKETPQNMPRTLDSPDLNPLDVNDPFPIVAPTVSLPEEPSLLLPDYPQKNPGNDLDNHLDSDSIHVPDPINFETANPSAVPSSLTPTPSKQEEPLIWEVDLAERGYAINKSPLNFSRIVQAYEKLTAYHCFGKLLLTLEQIPENNSRECNQLIEKTISYYPDDPIAWCAKTGIFSDECSKINDSTTIKEKTENNSDATSLLNDKLQQEAQVKKLSALEEKFSNIEVQTVENQQQLNDKKLVLLKIVTELINEACKNPTINLVPKESSYNENYDANKKDNITYQREILHSRPCMSYIDKALSIDAGFPAAICAQKGNVSPSCINAIKLSRNIGLKPVVPIAPSQSKSRKKTAGKIDLEEF